MYPGGATRLTESVVASATTIGVSTDIVRITGSTQIDTIRPAFGGQFPSMVVLIPVDGAVTLGAGGNILVGIAMAQNRSVWLVFSKSLGKWVINSGV